MANAAIANGGTLYVPQVVQNVKAPDGSLSETFQPRIKREVGVSPQHLDLMRRALIDVVQEESGTAFRARNKDGVRVAGKTGTAQNFEDAWFVGFTRHLSTAVWMGAPEAKIPMRNVGGRSVTGGSYPAMAWGLFMNAYHVGLEPLEFIPPEPTRSGRKLERTDNETLPKCAGMPEGDVEVDADFDDEPDCLGDHQPEKPIECPEGQVGIVGAGAGAGAAAAADAEDDAVADTCVPADPEGNPITTSTTSTTVPGGGDPPSTSTSTSTSTPTSSTSTSSTTSTSTTSTSTTSTTPTTAPAG